MSTDELTGHALLESARARKAESDRAARAALPVKPGDQFHVLKTGVGIHTGGGFLASSHISTAGETITVTAAMIEANYSMSGWNWMSLIGDDDAQIQRWGEVRFGLGQAPVDAPTWNVRGDADWVEQRNAAKAEAWNMPTIQARAEALAAVEQRFGPAATTATYSKYVDPSIKLAEEQRARLDAAGVRHVSHYEAQEPGVKR